MGKILIIDRSNEDDAPWNENFDYPPRMIKIYSEAAEENDGRYVDDFGIVYNVHEDMDEGYNADYTNWYISKMKKEYVMGDIKAYDIEEED